MSFVLILVLFILKFDTSLLVVLPITKTSNIKVNLNMSDKYICDSNDYKKLLTCGADNNYLFHEDVTDRCSTQGCSCEITDEDLKPKSIYVFYVCQSETNGIILYKEPYYCEYFNKSYGDFEEKKNFSCYKNTVSADISLAFSNPQTTKTYDGIMLYCTRYNILSLERDFEVTSYENCIYGNNKAILSDGNKFDYTHLKILYKRKFEESALKIIIYILSKNYNCEGESSDGGERISIDTFTCQYNVFKRDKSILKKFNYSITQNLFGNPIICFDGFNNSIYSFLLYRIGKFQWKLFTDKVYNLNELTLPKELWCEIACEFNNELELLNLEIHVDSNKEEGELRCVEGRKNNFKEKIICLHEGYGKYFWFVGKKRKLNLKDEKENLRCKLPSNIVDTIEESNSQNTSGINCTFKLLYFEKLLLCLSIFYLL